MCVDDAIELEIPDPAGFVDVDVMAVSPVDEEHQEAVLTLRPPCRKQSARLFVIDMDGVFRSAVMTLHPKHARGS